jgi:hypothetical protein
MGTHGGARMVPDRKKDRHVRGPFLHRQVNVSEQEDPVAVNVATVLGHV